MKSATTPPKKATEVTPRKAGRRPKSAALGDELSRGAFILCAIDLAQTASIYEVSMVRVAKKMGVAPGLVHYYVGSKNELLSAVLNHVYRERIMALPPLTGNWRLDIEGACRATLTTLERWPGSANYFATHNRFRLFQRVSTGETDYGLVYFDHLGRILKAAGFTPTRAAMVYDLTMMFVTSMSLELANRQAPKEHREFITGYVAQTDPKSIPGATFLVMPFTKISNDKRLTVGLQLLLDGFEAWLDAAPVRADTPCRKTSTS